MRSVLLGHRLLPWFPKLRPVVEPVVLDLLTSVASVAKRTIVGLLAITKPHLGREHKKGSNHSGYTAGFPPTSFVSGATYTTGPVLTSFLIFRFCQN